MQQKETKLRVLRIWNLGFIPLRGPFFVQYQSMWSILCTVPALVGFLSYQAAVTLSYSVVGILSERCFANLGEGCVDGLVKLYPGLSFRGMSKSEFNLVTTKLLLEVEAAVSRRGVRKLFGRRHSLWQLQAAEHSVCILDKTETGDYKRRAYNCMCKERKLLSCL